MAFERKTLGFSGICKGIFQVLILDDEELAVIPHIISFFFAIGGIILFVSDVCFDNISFLFFGLKLFVLIIFF